MKQYIFLVTTPVYNVQPYLLLFVSILSFTLAILNLNGMNFNSFMNGWCVKHNQIPKDSFWQKLYPFKKKPECGLLYITFIPLLLSFLILFAVLIVYVIYWIKPELMSDFLYSHITLYFSFAYLLIYSILAGLR